ncbi:hypothetical protein AWB91_08995 [Mycobacterium paraense]|uniref:Lsr2 family protein n=1 Tax=Mycobacterium paraense TaxID=767916 RepID=A0ABX3VUA6_9MYCO|nr:hypothetical protein AWB91_08995 [Mycobacterium paraense]ORW34687.1 hypothetical protein AWB88_02785 [Mycobacterium paraense]
MPFAYKGTNYEIDLTNDNAAAFDADMQRWVQHARKVAPGKRSKKKSGTTKTIPAIEESPVSAQRRRIRAWSNEIGHRVADKGVIKGEIIDAYEFAHPDDPILDGVRGKQPRPRRRKASASGTIATPDAAETTPQEPPSAEEQPDRFSLTPQQRAEVREWAQANGYQQSRTGQIKAEVLQAFYASNNGKVGARL